MRDHAKEPRFRRPEFQRKLKKASRYTRRAESLDGPRFAVFGILLRSRLAQVFGILFFLTLVYFLVVSPRFLVKKVSLTTPGASPEAVAQVLLALRRERTFLIPRNHLLLLNSRNLFAALQSELPEMKRITYFRRHWPDWIELGIEQREARYVWQSGNNFYFMDQDGIVFARLTNYLPQDYRQDLIVDRGSGGVKVGEQIEVKRHLEFINELKAEWLAQIAQPKIASFAIPGVLSSDIFAKTALGFEVYFDQERDAAVQLANLKLLLNQEIRPETYDGLSYIDVRLPNVAYYCYKDAPCAQNP
ncbi:MAG: hypothetical protein HY398_01035 [Candidatus Doudnabacteria bacterium]|nr:hypothetical protein [Candidatus Doudnabacteria bacterium]